MRKPSTAARVLWSEVGPESLATLWKGLRTVGGLSLATVAERLGWEVERLEGVEAGEEQLVDRASVEVLLQAYGATPERLDQATVLVGRELLERWLDGGQRTVEEIVPVVLAMRAVETRKAETMAQAMALCAVEGGGGRGGEDSDDQEWVEDLWTQ